MKYKWDKIGWGRMLTLTVQDNLVEEVVRAYTLVSHLCGCVVGVPQLTTLTPLPRDERVRV